MCETKLQQKNTWIQEINFLKNEDKLFLKNTYRVLLTRARQGMVIFIPKGCNEDITRQPKFYDGTYNYLKKLGIEEI
ncbi:DNA/RNA helicase domain-containing protein [Peptoniphilus lacrimalis]|uniref:DNA/RNA helicase domain-containing protein n=1 Tax=Peptoniphilus lacrimalis TaxID=33031 RepID=UPI0032AFB2AB